MLPVLGVAYTVRGWPAVLPCQLVEVLLAEAGGLLADPPIVFCTGVSVQYVRLNLRRVVSVGVVEEQLHGQQDLRDAEGWVPALFLAERAQTDSS